MTTNLDAASALSRLKEGNARYAQDLRSLAALTSHTRRADLVAGQRPFAAVLSCSDSRVPSELVFDCGLGELFVVRVAGNVVAPSILGSVEFAVATFGTALVVVMGHSRCGAVEATVRALSGGAAAPSESVRDIVDRIAPGVRELVRALPPDRVLPAATRANVAASVNQLCHGSRILEQRLRQGGLRVVGAEYALETGVVEFFDEGPGAGLR